MLALGYFEHRHLNRPRSSVSAAVLAVIMRRAAVCCCRERLLEQAGLFDERYFAYFEDAELCLRVRKLGFGSFAFRKRDLAQRVGQHTA